MSKENLHDYIDGALLAVGASSWFGMFQTVSEFFRLVLPITGFISFLVYLLLNRTKIKEAWKNWSGKKS